VDLPAPLVPAKMLIRPKERVISLKHLKLANESDVITLVPLELLGVRAQSVYALI